VSGNERLGAIIGAAVTLILFVGAPYLLPEYLPSNVTQLLAESGFDLQGFINEVMILGVITAALTLAKGFLGKASPVSLLISVSQNLAGLAFMVVLLGAGDVSSLGVASFTFSSENTTNHIVMDLRVFLYVTFLTVALSVVETYLAWNEARIQAMPPGRIPP
jgi:hypothetical protein